MIVIELLFFHHHGDKMSKLLAACGVADELSLSHCSHAYDMFVSRLQAAMCTLVMSIQHSAVVEQPVV